MKAQNKTKTQSANTIAPNVLARCQHSTPSGRRCKLPVEAPGKLLCYTHTQALMKSDVLNLKTALLTNCESFETAQDINAALANLYKLLAANYISPRRAAVLAYINSLLLRAFPPSKLITKPQPSTRTRLRKRQPRLRPMRRIPRPSSQPKRQPRTRFKPTPPPRGTRPSPSPTPQRNPRDPHNPIRP